MTNIESDELLREVLGELGQLRQLLAERLPPPAKIEDTKPGQAIVTGEAATPPPVTKPPVRTTPKRR